MTDDRSLINQVNAALHEIDERRGKSREPIQTFREFARVFVRPYEAALAKAEARVEELEKAFLEIEANDGCGEQSDFAWGLQVNSELASKALKGE